VATSFIAAWAGPASPSQLTLPAEKKARIVENYGKLPLSFEANQGQADKRVKFLSRGNAYGLYLTGNEAVLTLRKTVYGAVRPGLQRKLRPRQKSAPPDVVRMQLAGASGKMEPRGEEQLPGTANYFIGSDSAKWRTSIPTYAKVHYTGIYRGIDLVYYGNPSDGGQLEFDFAVAPHADPRRIQLRFDGPSRLRLAANGDLVVTTADGALAFHQPVVYQILDGRRHPVAGGFALLGKYTVGFRLGSYDRAKALVIDPALAFSTFLGGSGGESGSAIAVDSAGNVYVTGSTGSTNFPVTPGAFQTTNAAANSVGNAFVTKLNATGTALVYSTYLGGSGGQMGGDSGNAIAVDAAGDAYVAGQTYSTDFPVTPGAFQTTNHAAANETSNAFVTKLNPTGTALVYSTYLGGSSYQLQYWGDAAGAIAVDAAGDAYVAGLTHSPDFPVTQGAFQTTNNCTANECANAFITKLNPGGTALVYSTYLGGSGASRPNMGIYGDTADAIAVDAAGDAYVAGQAGSPNFPVTAGAFQTTNRGVANEDTNAFVTELDPAGTALVYSTYLGGSGNALSYEVGNAIAVDTAGNVYVAGQTPSADFPVTQGVFQTTNNCTTIYGGCLNAFISKLNPGGTALVYSTYLGGSGNTVYVSPSLWLSNGGDLASGLAIDSSGNVYVTGSTSSSDFPVTQGAYQTTNNDQPPCGGNCIGGYNAFITELNSTGSALVYSTYLGGNGINPGEFVGVIEYGDGDQGNALALDSSANVYVAGKAVSYDFPVTAGAFQTMLEAKGGNAFVAKLNMGATSTAITPGVTVTPASSIITSARPLTVTVSVSGGSGNPTPTGTVTLASGSYASAATTLSSGSATINIPAGSLIAEPAGYLSPDVLIARYLPDTASSSVYNLSSGVAEVTVVAADFSVTPSSTALTWGQSQSQALPVAIAAFVVNGIPVPTGTVTLTAGSYNSGATALSGGSATITIPPATLTAGFNALDLSYSGDSNYAAVPVAGSALVTVGTPNGTFTITGTAVTLTPGATRGDTSTITLTPSGGFAGSVALTAAVTSSPSGAQDPPTLSFGSTSPVTIPGPVGGTATLTITTTARGGCTQAYQLPPGVIWYTGGCVTLACLLLFAIPARRRRWRTALAVLTLLVALTGGWLACGGGSNSPPCTAIPGTTPGLYTITVTGTSGATTATGTVTLTVQ
jgi:hypothetical protein